MAIEELLGKLAENTAGQWLLYPLAAIGLYTMVARAYVNRANRRLWRALTLLSRRTVRGLQKSLEVPGEPVGGGRAGAWFGAVYWSSVCGLLIVMMLLVGAWMLLHAWYGALPPGKLLAGTLFCVAITVAARFFRAEAHRALIRV